MTIISASHAPKATIGNSIEFGKQIAIVSLDFKFKDVRRRTAKARHLSRN